MHLLNQVFLVCYLLGVQWGMGLMVISLIIRITWNNMQKLTVLVITHKDYEFPISACYRPIFVGKRANALKNEGFYQDNSGINIAEKNSGFCELTGLYWAWKTVYWNNEYVGLVHYRRYFAGKALDLKKKQIASESELLTILEKYDVILPRKRNYFIESIYSHYQHAHHVKDLNCTREIILNCILSI